MAWTQVLAPIIVIVVGVAFLYGVFVEPLLRWRALGRRLEVQRTTGGLLAIPRRCVVCGGAAQTSLAHKPRRKVRSFSYNMGSGRNASTVTTTTFETVTIELPYCMDHAHAAERIAQALSRVAWVVGTLVFLTAAAGLVLSLLGFNSGWRAPEGSPLVQTILVYIGGIVLLAIAAGLLAAAAFRGAAGIFDRTMRLMPLRHTDDETLGAKVEITPTKIRLRAVSPDFRREFAVLNHLTPA